MKRFTLPLFGVLCAAAIQGGMFVSGIVVNTTPSLPEGFYQKQRKPVEKGCYVLFRLPAQALSSHPYAREDLLKQVAAVEGDRVTIAAEGVSVNGRLLPNSAPLPLDVYGQALPHPELTDYTLKAGELLTMSSYNPRSFDSRYFGLVPRVSIIAVVAPVLTW